MPPTAHHAGGTIGLIWGEHSSFLLTGCLDFGYDPGKARIGGVVGPGCPARGLGLDRLRSLSSGGVQASGAVAMNLANAPSTVALVFPATVTAVAAAPAAVERAPSDSAPDELPEIVGKTRRFRDWRHLERQ